MSLNPFFSPNLTHTISDIFSVLTRNNPKAFATLQPIPSTQNNSSTTVDNTEVYGYVFFFDFWKGSLVTVLVSGLPNDTTADLDTICIPHFFGFHIHDGDVHYNPNDCPHPLHAGDLPPLLANNGFAWQMFYTGYFTPEEVKGKTAVIHRHADDFSSQPSGNAGPMIASGIIREYTLS